MSEEYSYPKKSHRLILRSSCREFTAPYYDSEKTKDKNEISQKSKYLRKIFFIALQRKNQIKKLIWVKNKNRNQLMVPVL